MTVTQTELDGFSQFAVEKIGNGGADLTLEDLVELWRAENPTDEELQESLASLERGLADAEAGRIHPADEALTELRKRLPSG